MKLYFQPFACSLAARIACIEGEIDAEFIEARGALPDGRDYRVVSPMGYVPALETPGGFVLTEAIAVLTYIAELAPEGVLAPPGFTDAHYRMLSWLSLTATELHKGVFGPLVNSGTGPEARAAAFELGAKRLPVLEAHLAGREFLEDRFTVADAYLLAVLNWAETGGFALDSYPEIRRYRKQLRQRPSVAAAMAAEFPLLKAA